jgi:5-methylcytosine-specific restriction endonuclease McrA
LKPQIGYNTNGQQGGTMKKADEINLADLIQSYIELKSSYKVAKKYGVSATSVKRILKKAKVLRTQTDAAKEKDNHHLLYERSEATRKKISEFAKTRTGNKNPFYKKQHTEEVKRKISLAAKKRTGERNPNYKNGNYKRRPRDFKNAEFRPLRNFTFNKDNYTCTYCGSMGGHLHAHHRIPYWICPEAFLDINNLVTVCTVCHFEKAHCGNWAKFDTNIIYDTLLEKYNIDRERLNELAGNNPDAIVQPSDIFETEESSGND